MPVLWVTWVWVSVVVVAAGCVVVVVEQPRTPAQSQPVHRIKQRIAFIYFLFRLAISGNSTQIRLCEAIKCITHQASVFRISVRIAQTREMCTVCAIESNGRPSRANHGRHVLPTGLLTALRPPSNRLPAIPHSKKRNTRVSFPLPPSSSWLCPYNMNRAPGLRWRHIEILTQAGQRLVVAPSVISENF